MNYINQEFILTLNQCAQKCKDECFVFVQRNALNSYLWILYASMFLITAYYIFHDNEKFMIWSKKIQIEGKSFDMAMDYLLLFGILGMIIYFAIFLIQMRSINPIS